MISTLACAALFAYSSPDSLGMPKFSPDGTRILLSSFTDKIRTFAVVDIQSGQLKPVSIPAGGRDLNWETDSTMLYTLGDQTDTHVLRLETATGTSKELYRGVNCQDVSAVRGGENLVLAYGPFPNIRVAVVDVKTSKIREVTPWGFSYGVSPSPDGKKIAFNHKTAPGPIRSAIYVCNLDGSELRCLSDGTMSAERPVWSPDGASVAFQASRRINNVSDANIYVAAVDGSSTKCITEHSDPRLDETPSWSPDGKTIAFQSNRSGKMWVYLMNADGSNVRPLVPLQR